MSFTYEERKSESPYIERVWRSQSERAGTFTSIASVHWEMVVRCSDDSTPVFTVRGPETKATPLDFPAGPAWFGITFKLGAFMPRLPPGNVMDLRDVILPTWRDAGTRQRVWLHRAMWEMPTYDNAEAFVERLAREHLLVCDPVVNTVLQGQPHALSPRAAQYRFLQATGLTHRRVVQIVRARHAMTLLTQGTSILDTVYETGYFDQPHLTRALRQFIGQTPARIAPIPER